MKKLFFFVALVCALTACRSDIDLGKVDTSMDVDLGLTLPVGNVQMMLTDMVGDVNGLYIDNKGVLTWKYDTTNARDYHPMDLAQYLSKKVDTMKVFDQLLDQTKDNPAVYAALSSGIPFNMPGEYTFTLNFPIELHLEGINENKTNVERLDSAIIEQASFYSIIRPVNLPFEWSWVNSIELDLGERFSRPGGQQVIVYDKNDPGASSYGYGDSIYIMVDKFTLNMMIDPDNRPDWKSYYDKVYDKCSFNIKFNITIPDGAPMSLNSGSSLEYTLGARFLDFSAIWGFFEPSSAMSNTELIGMRSAWKSLDFLTKSRMPFSEPEVKTQIITHVAGALSLTDSYIFTLDENNDTTYADFSNAGDGSGILFEHDFNRNEYLPLESAIGDSSTNMYITFNNTKEGGRIHRMFQKTPQKLGYKFAIGFNERKTPQIRITPNTTIRIHSTFTLPFIFDKGIWIEYPESSPVSLSQLSIDSLQEAANAIDTITSARVKLVMKVMNAIPLNFKYTMRCLDESNDTIMDPNNPSNPFLLFTQDTITFAPPTFSFNAAAGGWVPTPKESVMMVDLTKEQLNVFPKVKKIVYTAVLDDEALKGEYEKGLPNVRLTNQDYVSIKIGLAANVKGIVNFGNENK